MTEPAPTLNATLMEATGIVAGGHDLDVKLGALAGLARSAAGTSLATIHLLDEAGRWLVPTAGPDGEVPGEGINLSGAPEALTVALTERKPQTIGPDVDIAAALPFMPTGTTRVLVMPLVTATSQGVAEVDGVLMVPLSETPADREALSNLMSVADLAALSIRLTRLENALAERADWLDRVASTDPLTGLANRRTFERMLQLELVRAERQGSPVGLTVVAVDGLSELRERSGEAEADGVLRRVAATLAEQLRLVDTVARIGPDTFAAICPGSPGPEAALRVRDAVARLAPESADPSTPSAGPSSVSVGVARFPEEGTGADTLLTAAEAAVERARAQGPGSVVAPAGAVG